jgi:hypothetical protein
MLKVILMKRQITGTSYLNYDLFLVMRNKSCQILLRKNMKTRYLVMNLSGTVMVVKRKIILKTW